MKETQESSKAILIGVISQEFKIDHYHKGMKVYSTILNIERSSGTIDKILIKISERSLGETQIKVGERVLIEGELRSINYFGEDNKRHLRVYISAKKIKKISMEDIEKYSSSYNVIYITGYICKEPILRSTPFGRKITDVVIAVNRDFRRESSYIPSIAWSENAEYIYDLPIGTKLKIIGRIQSRDYIKIIDGQPIQKTATELSIKNVDELTIF